MGNFKKIMAKPDQGDEDEFKDGQENPLMKATGMPNENIKAYKTIKPSERFFARLYNIIEDSIKSLDKIENGTFNKIT